MLGTALALVLVRRLGDLDFGFYVASGRQFLAQGVPQNEFLAPLLSSEPLSSQWLISATLFAVSWAFAGPAGITLLSAACYAGGIILATAAAVRRGTDQFVAAVAATMATCVIAVRFVERPGCFSVLLLGTVMWLLAGSGNLGLRRRALLIGVFALWPWLHAEWLVGLAAAGLLLADREGPSPRSAATVGACVAVPVLLFAVFHPAGASVLLAPLRFLGGTGADFQVKEYGFEAFRLYPPLAAGFLFGPLAAWCAWRSGRRGEAIALAGLVLLSIKIPRALLPLMVLAIPAICDLVSRIGAAKARWQATAVIALLLLAAYGGSSRPGRLLGLGLDDRLDSRGIADALDRIPDREGYILSEFGMSSMLLVHPAVARQGIVMDGRQEAYPKDYFESVYTVALQPKRLAETDEDPRVWYARNGIAFYFETWEGLWPTFSPSGLYGHFSALGWQTIAWDNTGFLMAAPHVVRRHGLPTFDPPANVALSEAQLADPAALRALLGPVRAHTEELIAKGYPAPRPLIAQARIEAALGQWDDARKTLELARQQGGERYGSFGRIEEMIRAFGTAE